MTDHARPPVWLAIAIMLGAVIGAGLMIAAADYMGIANIDICRPAARCQIAAEVTA